VVVNLDRNRQIVLTIFLISIEFIIASSMPLVTMYSAASAARSMAGLIIFVSSAENR